jgi:hypothetical protein
VARGRCIAAAPSADGKGVPTPAAEFWGLGAACVCQGGHGGEVGDDCCWNI